MFFWQILSYVIHFLFAHSLGLFTFAKKHLIDYLFAKTITEQYCNTLGCCNSAICAVQSYSWRCVAVARWPAFGQEVDGTYPERFGS